MAKFTMTFIETKSIDVAIEVEIEADTPEAAAEAAFMAYSEGEYDTLLEESPNRETSECTTSAEWTMPDGTIQLF